MIDTVQSLSTNVVATVRRDNQPTPVQSRLSNASTSQQNTQPGFTLKSETQPDIGRSQALNDQIAELIQVAQTAAQSAASIEPAATSATAYGRATAAYSRMASYGQPAASPLLSLAI